jgi:hypothetical protein
VRLVPVPLNEHEAWEPLWLPFLPELAEGSRQSVADLRGQIIRREVRLILGGDPAPVAMAGVRVWQGNGEQTGDLIWLAGDIGVWPQLLSDVERMLIDAGCVRVRVISRPAWGKLLKGFGYKVFHVILEKPLCPVVVDSNQ